MLAIAEILIAKKICEARNFLEVVCDLSDLWTTLITLCGLARIIFTGIRFFIRLPGLVSKEIHDRHYAGMYAGGDLFGPGFVAVCGFQVQTRLPGYSIGRDIGDADS